MIVSAWPLARSWLTGSGSAIGDRARDRARISTGARARRATLRPRRASHGAARARAQPAEEPRETGGSSAGGRKRSSRSRRAPAGASRTMPAPGPAADRRRPPGRAGEPRASTLHGDRRLGGRTRRQRRSRPRPLGLGIARHRGGVCIGRSWRGRCGARSVRRCIAADLSTCAAWRPTAPHRAGIAGRRTGSAPAPPGDGHRDGQHPSGEREGPAPVTASSGFRDRGCRTLRARWRMSFAPTGSDSGTRPQ